MPHLLLLGSVLGQHFHVARVGCSTVEHLGGPGRPAAKMGETFVSVVRAGSAEQIAKAVPLRVAQTLLAMWHQPAGNLTQVCVLQVVEARTQQHLPVQWVMAVLHQVRHLGS